MTTVEPAAAPSMDNLPAIGLDQLDEAAALQVRQDRKYIVPLEDLDVILATAPFLLRVLEIDGLRRFRYQSVYFDTPTFRTYRDAAAGRPRRYKVRTRTYLDSDTAMTEVKLRTGRRDTAKHRIRRPPGSPTTLRQEDLEFLERFEPLITPEDRGSLRPALTSNYGRATLYLPGDNARATIDTALRCTDTDGRSVGLEHHAIVEIKTSGTPSRLDRSLWVHGYRPVKVSKYGTALAALRPGLPANKWTRVLRDHFGRRPSWSPDTTR